MIQCFIVTHKSFSSSVAAIPKLIPFDFDCAFPFLQFL